MDVVNRSHNNMIFCNTNGRSKQWDGYLGEAQFAFKLMVNRSTGRSLFSIVYTKTPNLTTDLTNLPKFENKVAADMTNNFDSLIQGVKEKLITSIQHYKEKADKSRCPKPFEVRDLVMVHSHKEWYLVVTYNKVQHDKMGPFPILKRINDNAYIIQLPQKLSFYSTFNISGLYAYKPSNVEISELKSSSSEAQGTWCSGSS